MPCDSGIELVSAEGRSTREQTKLSCGDQQMHITRLTADRAVAIFDFERGRCVHGELHRAAMAFAGMLDQRSHAEDGGLNCRAMPIAQVWPTALSP